MWCQCPRGPFICAAKHDGGGAHLVGAHAARRGPVIVVNDKRRHSLDGVAIVAATDGNHHDDKLVLF